MSRRTFFWLREGREEDEEDEEQEEQEYKGKQENSRADQEGRPGRHESPDSDGEAVSLAETCASAYKHESPSHGRERKLQKALCVDGTPSRPPDCQKLERTEGSGCSYQRHASVAQVL
ncbi:hypothetical protein LTR39_002529 [Cryomyces antarcticus]|nr:hypothetical protein LTR39_002529 [Cryomyces antarcticus]